MAGGHAGQMVPFCYTLSCAVELQLPSMNKGPCPFCIHILQVLTQQASMSGTTDDNGRMNTPQVSTSLDNGHAALVALCLSPLGVCPLQVLALQYQRQAALPCRICPPLTKLTTPAPTSLPYLRPALLSLPPATPQVNASADEQGERFAVPLTKGTPPSSPPVMHASAGSFDKVRVLMELLQCWVAGLIPAPLMRAGAATAAPCPRPLTCSHLLILPNLPMSLQEELKALLAAGAPGTASIPGPGSASTLSVSSPSPFESCPQACCRAITAHPSR